MSHVRECFSEFAITLAEWEFVYRRWIVGYKVASRERKDIVRLISQINQTSFSYAPCLGLDNSKLADTVARNAAIQLFEYAGPFNALRILNSVLQTEGVNAPASIHAVSGLSTRILYGTFDNYRQLLNSLSLSGVCTAIRILQIIVSNDWLSHGLECDTKQIARIKSHVIEILSPVEYLISVAQGYKKPSRASPSSSSSSRK